MEFLKVFLLASVILAVASGSAIIDPKLKTWFLTELGDSEETKNVMVSFTQGIQSVFDNINSIKFSNKVAKRSALTNAQQAFSNAAQAPLQEMLNTMGVNYQSFWINNKMVVPNASSKVVQAISSVPGVAKIEEEPIVKLSMPGAIIQTSGMHRSGNMPWGITAIRADKVWESYTGKGVVVAGIDTGVLYTHESLNSRWRTSYGWYDPYRGTTTPNDQNGHGTHTMGTIAGGNRIGVAPEATWIACKGCDTSSCGGSQLYACGQWVQCPTLTNGSNANCSMAPDVVSNSWGGPRGESWYDDIIVSWQIAGIVPVFAIGNSGPACSTSRSPGDRPKVISVGSLEQNNSISLTSSRGPASDGTIKPDITAPGGQVQSAWHTGNRHYATDSGTSMACPHVAGVVALMLQKKPTLTYQDIYDAITQTANRSMNTTGVNTCVYQAPSSYPNNVFGYGRIDAVNSVYAV